MTNGTIMVICGAFVGVSTFLIGRFYASRTPEWATELEGKNGGKPVDLAQFHLIGKVLMINAPILFVILAGIGLSGMAG